jgi:aryl-alcohol dehydrogenase-like predicted oxidoreductase
VNNRWGYRYTADWRTDTGGEPHEVKDHSLPHLVHQTGETSALLGSYLNLYQIHSATIESGVLENKEVLEELARLRREKGCRIGLSLSSPRQAETLKIALSARDSSGARIFDSVQATWNLLEQSAGEALLEAHHQGLHVIIKVRRYPKRFGCGWNFYFRNC